MPDIILSSPSSQEHITLHFKWKEILVSSLYPELVKVIALSQINQINYYHLISTTLEPERVHSDIQTVIRQGKRSQEMYERLKQEGYNPSSTSQHFCERLFDCAIDFQKIVRINKNSKVDISASRVVTLNSFNWLIRNCAFGFGQMYYTYPKNDHQIGFVHIGSVTLNHCGEVWRK